MKRATGRSRRGLFVSLVIAVAGVGAAWTGSKFWKPLGGRATGPRLDRIRASPHWKDGKFRNLIRTNKLAPGSFWRIIYKQFAGHEIRNPVAPIPINRLTAGDIGARASEGLRAVWIGHATVLADIDGMRIVTDPIWSERCSPLQSAGPKRFHPPPIDLSEVGRVDAVVISHDHYDHLDMRTIQTLSGRGAVFIVPLGIGAHLERWDVPPPQIRELDWNERAQLGPLTFVALPARHYSGRGVTDSDATLWASWAIIGPMHRIYFSGDTGFFDGLRDIGASLGPFDLTLIKIGAYAKEWPEIHIDPEEAVAVHEAVRGKVMLPIHWSTFNVGYHDWFEPAERLVKAGSRRISFVVPRPGEIVDPAHVGEVERWWRQ
ncbi:MAG: MBL fold metallo-hydrolase [Thermoanaerobaculia bacterium]